MCSCAGGWACVYIFTQVRALKATYSSVCLSSAFHVVKGEGQGVVACEDFIPWEDFILLG